MKNVIYLQIFTNRNIINFISDTYKCIGFLFAHIYFQYCKKIYIQFYLQI